MAAALGFTASAAHASLVLTEPGEFESCVDKDGDCVGGRPILALQSPGNATFEKGSISFDYSIFRFAIRTGDVVYNLTQVHSLSFLGVTSASSLRVVFKADEPAGAENGITLSDLVLTIYTFDGRLTLFTSGAFSPVTFADTSTGAGDLGFVFALDAQQAQEAQAAAFTGPFWFANQVGLSAAAGRGGAAPAGLGATGGFETFFVGPGSTPVPAIPEPETYSLMIAGLGLLGFIARRRRACHSNSDQVP
jgi:hypothetical protein